VTVKMRLGWDEDSIVAPQLAAALEDVGVAAVTVHGRTAAQKFSGRACLDGIARVVEAVRRIPVIGNGDIRRPEDASRMMQATGCSGVMIGRAALRDPWIFRDTHAFLTTGQVPPQPDRSELLAFVTAYFERLLRIRGERRACITLRQRFSWYAGRLRAHPDIRERMRRLSSAADFYELAGAITDQTAGTVRGWSHRATVHLNMPGGC
jgi:tRNA-dihydrouridine synthase B